MCQALEEIISSHTAGCPVEGVKWTYLSIREIQELLSRQGKCLAWHSVKKAIKSLGLGQRKLAKTEVMKQSSDRDEQFTIIQNYRAYYLSRGYAVLSVDTKKKELLGRFYRSGACFSTQSRSCWDHDYPSFATAKVTPHGIYDLGRKEGHLTLCQSPDTAELNVACLRAYWEEIGGKHYPKGTPVLLLVDGGGSNACTNRLFKQQLQNWANNAQLNIRVAHYPAYCSKYNPIEHRFFPTVTKSWKGIMFDTSQTMKKVLEKRVDLLKSDLKVTVRILHQTFETGVKVVDDFLDYCDIRHDEKIPKRNYRVMAMPKLDSY